MDKRDNSGVLFRNDRKEKETHPDYKGQATVDGVDMWVSAWVKEGAKGKFMSMSFQPKDEQAKPAPKAKGNAVAELDDSELPF